MVRLLRFQEASGEPDFVVIDTSDSTDAVLEKEYGARLLNSVELLGDFVDFPTDRELSW